MASSSLQSEVKKPELNLMLFLGAGASKEFEIPLFTEMHDPFLKDIKGKYHSRRLNRMKKELESVGFHSDIENYISYARGQIKPKPTILAMNPYVAYYVYRTKHPIVSYVLCRTKTKNMGKDESARALLNDLEDFIYSNLLIQNSYTKEKILSHYDNFFQFLRRKYFDGKNLMVDIFTTNYDDSIEFYCEERKLSIFDGFNEKSDGISYFEPELYKLSDIRLYKLHGSVRLGVVKDDQNNTAVMHSKKWIGIGEPYKGKWRLAERMMLLGHDKDISAEPCFELLRLMKEKLVLTKKCIAVGYSFNNGPILNIFKDVLHKKGDDFELVILCKSADKIKAEKFSNDKHVRAIKNQFSAFSLI